MRQLISVITKQILNQIKPNEINMVRLASFDSPIVYKAICDNLRNSSYIQNFVPKLTLEKYQQFEAMGKPNWAQALTYLHKGGNLSYNSAPDASYAERSYVDLAQAITQWRNESPNMPANVTSLVLLMGTEAAPDDKGSLEDTTFIISPSGIRELLSNDFSAWFDDILTENSILSSESKKAIHTLYRAIFASTNVNIFKFSDFIDSLHSMQFATAQELVNHICETLNTTWSIPSIVSNKAVPKVSKLSSCRLTDAKIITSGIKFI